jgi:hypothetical protein
MGNPSGVIVVAVDGLLTSPYGTETDTLHIEK